MGDGLIDIECTVTVVSGWYFVLILSLSAVLIISLAIFHFVILL